MKLLGFDVRGTPMALALERVERVVPMAAVEPLPGAPDVVLGALNVAGQFVVVVDLARRLGLPDAPIRLEDRLILATTARRRLGILASVVEDVLDVPTSAIVPAERAARGVRLRGIATLPDGLLLIEDPDAFLSIDEEEQLDTALSERDGAP